LIKPNTNLFKLGMLMENRKSGVRF